MVEIPESHGDLASSPPIAALTNLMPAGQPQSSLVWCDYDGECALVNTILERPKVRNLRRDPRVSLLIVDPTHITRSIEIRGQAELLTEGALDHLDWITRRDTRHPQYYGHILPLERKARDTRVIRRIPASRITLDAIHREKSSS